MIDGLTGGVIKELLQQYPYLSQPPVIWGKIIDARDTERAKAITVMVEQQGQSTQMMVKVPIREYAIRILDQSKAVATDYPAYPGILSDRQYAVGDTVAVAMVEQTIVIL